MRILLSLLMLSLFSACSSVNARRDPAVDITQFQHFYIEQRLNDNNGTGELIAADLRRRGYDATCGHLTMMPANVQVVITYDARWTWDFRSYLIDLSISANHVHSKKLIATGSYHQPGIIPKEPAKLIKILLDGFFE
jgi:hypothetical protein